MKDLCEQEILLLFNMAMFF